jgi:hypothetical protein
VKYETKMAAARRDLAVTVGVVGAPSSGIELVLSKNYLPVAQIRVICKNGPQVSIDDIKLLLQYQSLATPRYQMPCASVLHLAYIHIPRFLMGHTDRAAATFPGRWVFCIIKW